MALRHRRASCILPLWLCSLCDKLWKENERKWKWIFLVDRHDCCIGLGMINDKSLVRRTCKYIKNFLRMYQELIPNISTSLWRSTFSGKEEKGNEGIFIGERLRKKQGRIHDYLCRGRLGRGSNELGRGSNDLGRGMLKYKLCNP